jgi:hypothetical protein
MRHTVGVNPSGIPDPTAKFADRRQSSTSVGQVFAFVAGFIALAAVGAVIGWKLTGSPKPVNNAGPLTSPPVTLTPSTPDSTPSVSTPPPSDSGFAIPDYNAQGTTFVTARLDLIAHKLGVVLVFDSQGSGATVASTDPPAGTPVAKGISVKVFVDGPAPTLQVRNTVGESCSQAGKDLASDGLIVSYPYGKGGLVASTDPAADAPNVTWNQKIKIYCTLNGQLPKPSDGPSSPSDGTSSSPGTSG